MRWGLVGGGLVALFLAYYFFTGEKAFDPASVRNKRVLVTGASSGLGEQMAYHYARLGARLVITARRAEVLKKVIQRCREVGSKDGDYQFVTGDMSDMPQTKTVIKQAVDKLGGGLDFLVLNHVMDLEFDKWTGSDWNLTGFDRTLEINTKAYVHLAAHAQSHLEASGGSIVVVSAGWARTAPPYALAYVASKFALEGYFHGLRQEFQLRDIPIQVTVAVLGLIGTDMAYEKGADVIVGAFPPASPKETALEIIMAGGKRVKELYYPWMPMRPMCQFRDFMTGLLEMHWARIMVSVTDRNKRNEGKV